MNLTPEQKIAVRAYLSAQSREYLENQLIMALEVIDENDAAEVLSDLEIEI